MVSNNRNYTNSTKNAKVNLIEQRNKNRNNKIANINLITGK